MANTQVLTLMLSVFLILNSIIIPSFSCPVHQKQALLHFKSTLTAIYRSKYSIDYVGLHLWISTFDCCSWKCVNCSRTGSVTELQLYNVARPPPGFDLVTISSDILTPLFHIRSLELLDISLNYFEEGEIPGDGFGNLTKLLHLDMCNNNFNGSIPSQLFQLTNLRYLDMSYNILEGKLGPELGSFQNLTALWLNHNRFQGPIPAQLFELKSLQDLDLRDNKLDGGIGNIPLSLGNLVRIESLDVSHNELSGSIPQSLGQLGNLTVLDVSNNMLKGKIPRGRQMDTMNELSYFQNNDGLCGMQIKVTCQDDIPSPEGRVEEEEDLSWMFWEGTFIGFPIGFFSTILIMSYLIQLFKFW